MKKISYSAVVITLASLLILMIIRPEIVTKIIFKPDNAAQISSGKVTYMQNCASCHGDNLQGQDNWKSPLPSGRLPAPPHNTDGHTWHHPDKMLFTITKFGPAAIIGDDYKSDMPSFTGILNDDEIRAVLAYIKSTWPKRSLEYQQKMTQEENKENQ